MKSQMPTTSNQEQDEVYTSPPMEDAVNQIRRQKHRQREQKAAQEKLEEEECDRFLGDHGIDFEELTAQEKRDIRRALENSTEEISYHWSGGCSTSFSTQTPQPCSSGVSTQSSRWGAGPDLNWNDSEEESDENWMPPSRGTRPATRGKRPSPEGDDGREAKMVRLSKGFYGSKPEAQTLIGGSRRLPRSDAESKVQKSQALLMPRPSHTAGADRTQKTDRKSSSTRSASAAKAEVMMEMETLEEAGQLRLNWTRSSKDSERQQSTCKVHPETATTSDASPTELQEETPQESAAEEIEVFRQFTEELSAASDCQTLQRKYRSMEVNENTDVYQALLSPADPKEDHTRLIVRYFNDYFRQLCVEQARKLTHLDWGAPVVQGRHHSRTVDRKLRGQESFVWSEESEGEADLPDPVAWKPSKCRLSKSGRSGKGGKAKFTPLQDELPDLIIEEGSNGGPIPLPGPSMASSSEQGHRGDEDTVPQSIDCRSLILGCDLAPACSRRAVGSGDVIPGSQSSTSDTILNSQGDLYSTQFPRKKILPLRDDQLSENSNDSVEILSRSSKRKGGAEPFRGKAAVGFAARDDSVIPSRKKSRPLESGLARQRRGPGLTAEFDSVSFVNDEPVASDVYDMDEDEESERQDFSNYLAKTAQVKTYSRRRPVENVPFAGEDGNVFDSVSKNSAGSEQPRPGQGEESSDEVQLLSPLTDEVRCTQQSGASTPAHRHRAQTSRSGLDRGVEVGHSPNAEDLISGEVEEEAPKNGHSKGQRLPCPMCQREFPVMRIHAHAALCNGPEPEPQRIVTRRARENRFPASHPRSSLTEHDLDELREPLLTPEAVVCMYCDEQFPEYDATFKLHVAKCQTRATVIAKELEQSGTVMREKSRTSNPPATRSRAGAACQ